ncbi:MAG: tRNA 4-thiouridine(8) synthase ThiI [Desulfatiglandales bacterium]
MKALSVFSGGLDSMLAVEIVRAQDVEVLGLFFESPFFSSEKARGSASSIRLPLKVIDITKRHLEVVKNPKHGHGENMNPCIDCHALMIRCAGERLEEEGAKFIITGEVLGQRPMSQNRRSLALVAKESGFDRVLLRPLSAKRLPQTLPEEMGWIDRERLLDWSGRSRKPQMALADRLGIEGYPSPAGGCLLTDAIFSRRLRDLLSSRPECKRREIDLLKLGRHFRIDSETKLIVGRNKRENQEIEELAEPGDLMLKTTAIPGPTVLVLGDLSSESEDVAAAITASYSDAPDGGEAEVMLTGKGSNRVVYAIGRKKEAFKPYMI